jgi:hypothetical protein
MAAADVQTGWVRMTKGPAGLVGGVGVGVEGAGGSLVLEALVVVVVVVGDHLWLVVAPHVGRRRRHELGVREGVRRGEGR